MIDVLQASTWFLLWFSLTCASRSQQAGGTEAVVGFHRPNATASVWRVNPNKQGPDLNIGVIQVRLSNWTEKPTTLPPSPPSREFVATNIPKGQRNRNWKRRQQTGSVNVRRAQLTPYDASPEQDDDTTFRIGRLVDPDSAFAYTIVAISFGLVGILALVYGILTVLSNRSKKRMYLESGGDLLYQHPSELERLYHRQHERRDMEWKRPPLV
ncbi:hypothetical protein AAVH_10508 [Aphelenchoides avenae]|nr:hypothetical protein AAVH_10508 [Aphelenchus avenae]